MALVRAVEDFTDEFTIVYDKSELEAILCNIGELVEDPSAIAVLAADGEYKEVWASYDRRPYLEGAEFYPLWLTSYIPSEAPRVKSKIHGVSVEFANRVQDVRIRRTHRTKTYKNVGNRSYYRLVKTLEKRIHNGEMYVEFGLFGYRVWC